MKRLLTVPVVLMVLSSLALGVAASAQEPTGDCACGEAVWGIQRGVGVPFIYSIDLGTKTSTFIANTDKNLSVENYPNGVAYDVPSNRLYYAEQVLGDDSLLHFYDFAGNQVLAGGLTGTVAGATIHNGVYYYIPQGSGDLYAATLLADGSIGTNSLIKSDISGAGFGYVFGDMAITADGTTMYVSAGANGSIEFFSIDLSGNNYELIATGDFGLQLAFGVGGVLYGHDAGSGIFYIVDTTTGALTEIGTVSGSETGKFTDLASFQTCIHPQ